jgi:hypothetical protein
MKNSTIQTTFDRAFIFFPNVLPNTIVVLIRKTELPLNQQELFGQPGIPRLIETYWIFN